MRASDFFNFKHEMIVAKKKATAKYDCHQLFNMNFSDRNYQYEEGHRGIFLQMKLII